MDADWERLKYKKKDTVGKTIAICIMCNKELKGTQLKRLKYHRKICKANMKRLNIGKEKELEPKMDIKQDDSETNLSDCAEMVLQMKEEPVACIYLSEDEFIHLIRLFKQQPILYNPHHKYVNSKTRIITALTTITDNMRKFKEDITIEQVELKLKELVEQYKRELLLDRHVKDIEAVPEWCKHMNFLRKYLPGEHYVEEEENENLDYSESLETQVYESQHPQADTSSNELITYLPPENVMQIQTETESSQDQTFLNYIRTEMSAVRNEDLKDELRQKITSIIFEYKRKQRSLINDSL